MQFKILKKFCSSKIISNMNKIKIIGYPFAGGQNRDGVEDTPTWLFE
jgi:arginase family enzyme